MRINDFQIMSNEKNNYRYIFFIYVRVGYSAVVYYIMACAVWV